MPKTATPNPRMEIRNLLVPPELRAEGDGNTLVGHASLFNEPIQPYLDWPEYVEIVHPDAFTRTLREMPDVRALKNHNWDDVLGRTTAGTLRLSVDEVGLYFENDLPDTTAGRDTKVSVERRDITGCSIGFCCVMDEVVWNRDSDVITRTLMDVDLYEITPACAMPANTSTDVALRSAMTLRLMAPSERPNNRLIRLIHTRRNRRPSLTS